MSGNFGIYGGRYVPEMLIGALDALAAEYKEAKVDIMFQDQLALYRRNYTGGPSPLVEATRLQEYLDGPRIFLKNEGNNHTGAHKINHCIGQALLAQRMGKKRLIAETGAGQHGVATATVAAKFGMQCTVYMGAVDIARQRPNVHRMQQLGAEVITVTSGSQTLKDAVNEALKDFMGSSDTTHYVIGSVLGPHPYPEMNRDFQSVIGKETRQQLLADYDISKPTALIACVGGGSNAIGLFSDYIAETDVKLIGIEAGGKGDKPGQHAKRINVVNAREGIFQGHKSRFLQTSFGNIADTHSIAAGLDYPGIGPELAYLASVGRITFDSAVDKAVLGAYHVLAITEGILPALESAHAVAYVIKHAQDFKKDDVIVIGLSGSGDKDMFTIARNQNDTLFKSFLLEEAARYA
jgi:tryptophan synthase beta chain